MRCGYVLSRQPGGMGWLPRLPFWLFFSSLLAASFFVYKPGLTGGFILDDYQNLKGLEFLPPALTWAGIKDFSLSGVAGFMGRPLSMATFALQAASWPEHPGDFKYFNFLLHLLNGCVLLWLWLILGRLLDAKSAPAVALLAVAWWLWHPLNVSTTLYVVQRMTQMSAFFSLLGMALYFSGRERLQQRAGRGGYALMAAGIVLCGGLAVLCKETGALLPVYVLAIEATLLRDLPWPRHGRLFMAAVLLLPLGAGMGYLLWHFDAWVAGHAFRDFSMPERLLTQARVMVTYLGMIVFPRGSGLGVFHDDFPLSRDWLNPPETALAIALLAGLVLVAVAARRRVPELTFAVVWFFGGHLAESTIIPLEIYFEHRNYLPMAGVLYAVALAMSRLWHLFPKALFRRMLVGAAFVWLALLAVLTHAESRLWGNPTEQAIVWAREHPRSARAQENLGNVYARSSQYLEAARQFSQLAQSDLDFPAAYVLWLMAGCYDSRVVPPDPETMRLRLSQARFSNAPVAALEQLVLARERRECGNIATADIESFLETLLANPSYWSHRPRLLELLGRLRPA